jgi:hypothetical protein
LLPGMKRTCFKDAEWWARIENVVWVVMSTTLAVWSPEAVARSLSSSENTISIMALVWTRKPR